MSAAPPVIVVGAGSSGLLAALELAGRGVPVTLVDLHAARRGPTASAGRSLAVDDDVEVHLADAIASGGGAGDARVLRAMIAAAPAIADDLVRRGVPFDRDAGGASTRRRGVGHATARLLEADLATDFHVVHTLDVALRACGAVTRLEGWEVIELVRDLDGVCVGVVAQHLHTMEIRGFPASAVVLASGGFAASWAGSTASRDAVGSATAAAVRAGATITDPDRVDVHPIAALGGAKPFPIPDALRALGATVWAPRDRDDRRRPRDVPASDREVLVTGGPATAGRAEAGRTMATALAEGRGIVAAGRRALLLDARSPGVAAVRARLGRVEEAIERATGLSIGEVPIPVVPAVHATLGGLAVHGEDDDDLTFATSIPGLFAIGGAAASPAGAARLAGHRLLGGLFGAGKAAAAAAAHVEVRGARAAGAARLLLDRRAVEGAAHYDRLVAQGEDDGQTAEELIETLRTALLTHAGPAVEGGAGGLEEAVVALRAAAPTARPGDRSPVANRGATALRRLDGMVLLASAVAAAARLRAADPGGLAPIRLRLVDGTLERVPSVEAR